MNNFDIRIGKKIRELRSSLNISQDEFCKMINNIITRSNLSKIELGKISISAEVVKSISEKFEISPYYLLDIDKKDIDKNEECILKKYRELDEKDKIKMEAYLDFIYLEKNQGSYTSMNTKEKKEGNKISS